MLKPVITVGRSAAGKLELLYLGEDAEKGVALCLAPPAGFTETAVYRYPRPAWKRRQFPGGAPEISLEHSDVQTSGLDPDPAEVVPPAGTPEAVTDLEEALPPAETAAYPEQPVAPEAPTAEEAIAAEPRAEEESTDLPSDSQPQAPAEETAPKSKGKGKGKGKAGK